MPRLGKGTVSLLGVHYLAACQSYGRLPGTKLGINEADCRPITYVWANSQRRLVRLSELLYLCRILNFKRQLS